MFSFLVCIVLLIIKYENENKKINKPTQNLKLKGLEIIHQRYKQKHLENLS
jgi:uncharacterized membrane protein